MDDRWKSDRSRNLGIALERMSAVRSAREIPVVVLELDVEDAPEPTAIGRTPHRRSMFGFGDRARLAIEE